ncbi:hypothetical protein [Kribbella deserti]|uniref:Uncharacterized protein n=1 Tax=Kribbella deserti TaxID=1926257 RepID=A0ABV6QLT2_9ACTN
MNLNAPSRRVVLVLSIAVGLAAGVRHHVLLSIVGIDGVPSGSYAGKLAQETLVTQGDVLWSILRAKSAMPWPV